MRRSTAFCTNTRPTELGGLAVVVVQDPADTLQWVTIESLPVAGSLELSTVAVTVGQQISFADINAGNLKFVPDADTNGTGYASFDFTVNDVAPGGEEDSRLNLDARGWLSVKVKAAAYLEETPKMVAHPAGGNSDDSNGDGSIRPRRCHSYN